MYDVIDIDDMYRRQNWAEIRYDRILGAGGFMIQSLRVFAV